MVKKSTKDNTDHVANAEGNTSEEMIEDTGKKEADLMVKLEEKEKEAAENYDKYVRAVAELENYRKRAAKEKTDSIKYGNENLIRDILPHVDSLKSFGTCRFVGKF